MGKLLEKCFDDTIYSYFEKNGLFSSRQSGFRKNDSCVSQLLAIALKIFCGFNSSPSRETRGIFLDISKAFDKVWHKGLLLKLKTCGIQGQLLKLIKAFLTDRLQRVVHSGKSSDWKSILAGGGIYLRTFIFLFFINDLPDGLQSILKIFADDTDIYYLVRISEWACQWKMSFNPDPKKQAVEGCFTQKQKNTLLPDLIFNNAPVSSAYSTKHLGLFLDKRLPFYHHLKEKLFIANRGIGLITRLRKYIPRKTLLRIYKSFVRPHLDYGDIIFDNPTNDYFTQKT